MCINNRLIDKCKLSKAKTCASSKSINVRSICVTKLLTKLQFTNINNIHQQNSRDGAEQIDQNDVNHQNNSQGNTNQTNHGNSMTNKQSDLFNVALWNAQSVGNKIPTVNGYLNDPDLDMDFIVESWLSDQDKMKIGDLEGKGYRIEHTLREERKGGGIISFQKIAKCKENQPTFCD